MKRAQCVILLIALTGCDVAVHPPERWPPKPSPRPTMTDSELAIASFWKAFRAGAHEEISAVRERLSAAHEKDANAENTLVLAHANLWATTHFGDQPDVDPRERQARAADMVRYFTEAAERAPDDFRIDGWLGSAVFGVGAATQNSQMMDDGQRLLDRGVARFPEFNLFVRALVNGQYPVGHPSFTQALDDMWKTIEICRGSSVRACSNIPKAPHNLEGFLLYLGDLLVKAGDAATAKKIYADIPQIPEYDTWPFHDLLTERQAHVDERTALYLDNDANNDPVIATHSSVMCATCHGTR